MTGIFSFCDQIDSGSNPGLLVEKIIKMTVNSKNREIIAAVLAILMALAALVWFILQDAPQSISWDAVASIPCIHQ